MSYSTLIVKVADGTVENNRAQLGQDVYAYKTKADTVLHLPQASKIHDNGRWLNENTSETLKDEPIDYDPIQRTYPLTLSVPKVETEVAQIVKAGEVVGGPYNSLQEEITTKQIGEMVMSSLRQLDEVAYVRFASVYRQFKDIDTFMKELNKLLEGK